MTRAQEAAYWEDYKVVGKLFGLREADMPDTLADLDDYRREMLEGDVLHVSDWAREQARAIVLDPPVPLYAAAAAGDGQLHHDRAAARPHPARVRLLAAAAGRSCAGRSSRAAPSTSSGR